MSTYKIDLSVIVKKRTTIIPSSFCFQAMQRLPRTCNFSSCRHKIAFIGRTEINIKFPLMVADSSCPNTSPIAVHACPVHFFANLVKIGNHMTFNSPVYQIFGMEYHHTRRILESRRNSVIIIAHPDAINVAVIGRNNGVTVSAVSLIPPCQPFSPLEIILCEYIHL